MNEYNEIVGKLQGIIKLFPSVPAFPDGVQKTTVAGPVLCSDHQSTFRDLIFVYRDFVVQRKWTCGKCII